MAIYLDVPFEEKDIVKALGAKWASEKRQWFIPAGVDTDPFAKWIPRIPKSMLIAPVWLSKSIDRCWKCGQISQVFCLTASAAIDNHFIRGPVYISNLVYAAPDLVRCFGELAPGYFPDYSQTQEAKLFMNHCQHCRAKLGDFYMHNEPGGAFHPATSPEKDGLFRILLSDTGRYPFEGTWGVRG